MKVGASGKGLPSICLVSNGIDQARIRLQPWHYLYQVANQLATLGHEVTVLSDKAIAGDPFGHAANLRFLRLDSTSQGWWRKQAEVYSAVAGLEPDVLLWHLGLTSFLSQRFLWPRQIATVGIFTSPLYTIMELSRIGWRRLIGGYRLSAIHLVGAMIPRRVFGLLARRPAQLCHMVVQTAGTRARLSQRALWTGPISVIPPGVDPVWRAQASPRSASGPREALSLAPSDALILYFGPPSPLRGLHTLVDAFCRLREQHSQVRLIILSRGDIADRSHKDRWLRPLLSRPEIQAYVHLVDGVMEPEILASYVRAADVVALPFELVSSDAPVSLLEAHALGKRLVTTSVPGLPDLSLQSPVFRSKPGDPGSLARALHAALQKPSPCHYGAAQLAPYLPTRSVPSWKKVGSAWSQLLQHLEPTPTWPGASST